MVISNNKGFTLLEALFALGILMLILASVPLLLAPLTQDTKSEAVSVRQALHFISMEVHKGSTVYIAGDRLYIQDQQGRTAVFEQYKDMIRRQVEEKGHEVYLHHIEDLKITQDSSSIDISVTGKEGELYEKRIALE
ncbi:competence type IV pilus minor pilin ComGF [Terribacillus saccharophilus]|uniref:competence type IV pilus minor pilin ComGF n=1 Tax=Terribacillus saccharophilus TaxID=361277 RepID=UPI003982D577